MRRAVALALLWPMVGSAAAAPTTYTTHTSCKVFKEASVAGDDEGVLAGQNFVMEVIRALDENHTKNGEPSIVSLMTDDEFRWLAVDTGVYCQMHEASTVFNAAGVIYRRNRDAAISVGRAR